MTPKFGRTTLTLSALLVATIASAALADKGEMGGMGGPGMMPLADFAAIDADKDGKITKDEVTAFLTTRATEADADKDGKLSAEELVAMREKAEAARKLERAKAVIERMDGDGDGLLTPAEMVAADGPARMFEALDTDGDSALSQAEVDAMKARMQERMGGKHHKGRGGFFGWMHGDSEEN